MSNISPLINVMKTAYNKINLPEYLKKIPITKPGSRFLR